MPGRGPNGPILLNLFGDHTLGTVGVSRYGPNGCAEVIAYRHDGSEVWTRSFNRFPGEVPPWNVGGFIMGGAARLTASGAEGVWLTFRRCSMHSDETHTLYGVTSLPLFALL